MRRHSQSPRSPGGSFGFGHSIQLFEWKPPYLEKEHCGNPVPVLDELLRWPLTILSCHDYGLISALAHDSSPIDSRPNLQAASSKIYFKDPDMGEERLMWIECTSISDDDMFTRTDFISREPMLHGEGLERERLRDFAKVKNLAELRAVAAQSIVNLYAYEHSDFTARAHCFRLSGERENPIILGRRWFGQ